VRQWPGSSAERVAARSWVLIGAAALILGLASEPRVYPWDSFTRWLPDLTVGLVFVGCGARVWSRDRGTAVILAGVGYSWFLANFVADLSFLHRGLLVHLLVTYPGGRPRSLRETVAVGVGYVIGVVWPIWNTEAASIVLAAGLVLVVAAGLADAPYRLRQFRRVAMLAALAFALAVVVGDVVRLVVGDFEDVQVVTLLYDLTLAGVAVALTAVLPATSRSSMVDLVVELGDAHSRDLADALASTLGDPTLEVGYWDGRGGYVDAVGAVVAVPRLDGARTAMFVDRESRPFAVIVHDAVVLGEPALVDAVAAATRLSAIHTELQAAVHDQLIELAASRRRLVTAGDEERRRLGDRLQYGAEAHLRELDDVLRRASRHDGTRPERVERALEQLARTIDDLRELGAGLHPRELDRGLGAALHELAARCPLPVALDIRGDEADPTLATALYYVCAEALANTVKHAAAKSAAISVRFEATSVQMCVSDDGSGGAQSSGSSGLRGLMDRIEALGGTLQIDSPQSRGTRLTVELTNGATP
jgi:signal transduction histidine kinase